MKLKQEYFHVPVVCIPKDCSLYPFHFYIFDPEFKTYFAYILGNNAINHKELAKILIPNKLIAVKLSQKLTFLKFLGLNYDDVPSLCRTSNYDLVAIWNELLKIRTIKKTYNQFEKKKLHFPEEGENPRFYQSSKYIVPMFAFQINKCVNNQLEVLDEGQAYNTLSINDESNFPTNNDKNQVMSSIPMEDEKIFEDSVAGPKDNPWTSAPRPKEWKKEEYEDEWTEAEMPKIFKEGDEEYEKWKKDNEIDHLNDDKYSLNEKDQEEEDDYINSEDNSLDESDADLKTKKKKEKFQKDKKRKRKEFATPNYELGEKKELVDKDISYEEFNNIIDDQNYDPDEINNAHDEESQIDEKERKEKNSEELGSQKEAKEKNIEEFGSHNSEDEENIEELGSQGNQEEDNLEELGSQGEDEGSEKSENAAKNKEKDVEDEEEYLKNEATPAEAEDDESQNKKVEDKEIRELPQTVNNAIFQAIFQNDFVDLYEEFKKDTDNWKDNHSQEMSNAKYLCNYFMTSDNPDNRIVLLSYYHALAAKSFDDDEIVDLVIASFIHRIGLTQINRNLSFKPEKSMDFGQHSNYQKYISLTEHMLKKIDMSLTGRCKRIVKEHRERSNAKGFPLRKNYAEVHPLSSILGLWSHMIDYTQGRVVPEKTTLYKVFKAYQSKVPLPEQNQDFSEATHDSLIKMIRHQEGVDVKIKEDEAIEEEITETNNNAA